MTKSIILSTAKSRADVVEAIRNVGFLDPAEARDDNHYRDGKFSHDTIGDLCIQIIERGESRDLGLVDGHSIQMELNGLSDRLPDNPKAIEVLRYFNILIPDLLYTEYTFPLKEPDKPLSDYLNSRV